MLRIKDRVKQFIGNIISSKKEGIPVEANIAAFGNLIVLIGNNLDRFSEFGYYIPIIKKAERNEFPHPDITIECCNSLIQGISKTIVLRLDPTADKVKLEKNRSESSTDTLFKRALICMKENNDVYEDDFVRRGVSLALAISTLRNARGDISHGRAVPKELQSNRELARVVMDMTATLLRYTLASFYTIELEQVKEDIKKEEASSYEVESDLPLVNYDENDEFNNYLDDQYDLDGKMIYSKALYELYYEDYLIKLDDYKYSEEIY